VQIKMRSVFALFMTMLIFGSSSFAVAESIDFDKLFENNAHSPKSERVIENKRTSSEDARQARDGTNSIDTPRTWIGSAAHAIYSCDDCSSPFSDMKNLCLGETQDKSNCYSIQDSDMKNLCLGETQDKSYCYSIHGSDMKSLCLGRTQGKSNCYSIQGSDMKNLCLGGFQDKSYCYSIQNSDMKNLCLGETQDKSYCYSIN